jgi:U3 small nucleolar RNA-associated protein 3
MCRRSLARICPPGACRETDHVVGAHLQAKKQAKAERNKVPELHPPLPDQQTDGARKITREIMKNRGLTPHRKKSTKNPRKHAREKHENAEKRRKGQVQAVRKPTGPYGGEGTGIKARVSKSVRLG